MPEPRSLRGRLLIAAPPLVDPNFDGTVVLMLEHGDDGALGLVLNRPSETAVGDVFPEWRAAVAGPDLVFVGGPVSTDAVIALGRSRDDPGPNGFVGVVGDLGTIDLADDPDEVTPWLRDLRVFAGYSGWAPGQLESELAQEAWFVVDLEPGDPFAGDPHRLWRDVLRRQRGRLAMFANYPDDAATN